MRFLQHTDKFTEDIISGAVAVIYGGTGVGKTVSAIQTLMTPICLINMEPRDPRRAIITASKASGIKFKPILKDFEEPKGDIACCNYTNWTDARQFTAEFDFTNYNSIILDGGTEMSNHITELSKHEYWESLSEKERKIASLTKESTTTYQSFNTIFTHLNILVKPLFEWSQKGKYIVFNVLLADEKKEWMDSFEGRPQFDGKKFADRLPGKVDLIGMATKRFNEKYDDNGKLIKSNPVYPPWVQFEQRKKQNFECKWSGEKICLPTNYDLPDEEKIMEGPLDFGIWFEFKKYNPKTKEWIYQKGYENHKPVIEENNKEVKNG